MPPPEPPAGPPRLRMFAGPNGSGKTTVKREVAASRPAAFLGAYVNPDDLEAAVAADGRLDLGTFGLHADDAEIRDAFATSPLLAARGLTDSASALRGDGRIVDFGGLAFHPYHASVLADFLRRKLLAAGASFSFETVMSHPDKIDLLREARGRGYRTYLYYVATEDPEINVSRVAPSRHAGRPRRAPR